MPERYTGPLVGTGQTGRGKTLDSKSVIMFDKTQLVRLAANRVPVIDIAKTMQRSTITICKWLRDPEILAQIKALNEEAFSEIDAEIKFRVASTHDKLNVAADEALDKVIDLMRGADSEVIQFKAATDLLDRRADTSKVHRIDKRQVNVNIDAKWLELAAKAEQEEQGQVINGV